ncbi:MAG: hypothetical protein ACI9WU_002174 [Myxococcota bacterium]
MRWLRLFVADFRHFLVHYKAWWITPIVLILLSLALFAAFADDTAVRPWIYAP